MNETGRRCQRILSAIVVAAFAAFWLLAFLLNDPPEFPAQYLVTATATAIVATPWVIAVRLLWRAFWKRAGARLSALDGPAWLLDAAVAALPRDRRDWGAAMTAELEHVEGRSARWQFSAGCARTALFPPRGSWWPVLVIVLFAPLTVAAVSVGVGHVLPAMRIFGVTFVSLIDALVVLAVARSLRLREQAPRPIISAAGVLGVIACIRVTAYFLLGHPTAAAYLSPMTSVVFAIELVACLWFALTPPRGLSSSRLARGFGLGTAIVFGTGFLATSRATIGTMAGPLIFLLFGPSVIFFAASLLAARFGRSFRAGVETALWTALLATLLVFAISVPEATRRFSIDGRTLADGESGLPIGVNLLDAIRWVPLIALLGVPFGVIGAAVGRRSRGTSPSESSASPTNLSGTTR